MKKKSNPHLNRAVELASTFLDSKEAIPYLKNTRKGKLSLEKKNGITRLKFDSEGSAIQKSNNYPAVVGSIANTVAMTMKELSELKINSKKTANKK